MKLPSSSIFLTVGMMSLTNLTIADTVESQKDAKGFIEDSHLEVISRTMYMSSNPRHGGYYSLGGTAKREKDTGQAENSGTSLIGLYSSGYTQGTVGFGVDAIAMQALSFDNGRGHSGDDNNNMFSSDGRSGRSQNYISKLAPSLKLRVSKTELKYGQMMVDTPVFATQGIDDKLLPQDATGFFLSSKEVDKLTVNAGYFTALREQEFSHNDSVTQDSDFSPNGETLRRAIFAGLEYQFTDNLSGQVYASRNKDFWRKYYTNLNYTYNINTDNSVNFDFNWYNTKSIGKGYADVIRSNGDNRRINSNLWSLAAAYTYKVHTFTLAYQRNSGRGGLGGYSYLYDVDGGGAIAVANSVQYSDFKSENQRSWQLGYNLDFSDYGVPGLNFGILYVKGTDAVNANQNNRHNGKAWERDIDISYTIQEGKAKDLSLALKYATYRSNFDGSNDYSVNGRHNAHGRNNVDEVRVILQYPWSIL
ncbi:outer membrane porin, OprD family [Gammaproteobacteria bacterium ESL0073]|nr:outer membrane porin, OprD family [Gammaproteobacteria bacterium ESL0073]